MIVIYYLLFYVVIKPLSLIPTNVLYVISDGIYYLVFHLVGYRKKVVWQNLKNSFPEKKEDELKVIQKQFYHNFCDLIVESIKTFSITEEEIKNRCACSNPELLEKLYAKYPAVIAYTGHLANWEMCGMSTNIHTSFWPVVSYKPFSNKKFEKLMTKSRTQFLSIIPYYNVKEIIQKNLIGSYNFPEDTKADNIKKPVFIFLPDQSVSQKNSFYWTNFLNQETSFYTKVEDWAKENNLPVIYADLQRLGNGKYNIHMQIITETPNELGEFEITQRYTKLLEQSIQNNPSNWLWSHKRWKRKKIVVE